MLDGLRGALSSLGLTPFDIQLPDEDPAVAPLEGALRVRALPRQELDTLAGRVAPHYVDLQRQLREEPGGFVVDLPPALPLDRIGALDGVHTYPMGTPFEHRSLPPTALRPENDVHKFLTTAQVRVWVAVTPPWFGRPGGGIRFTLQQPETGLRDLVASGRLQRVQIVG
jgi:hypothetical protein